MFQLLIRTLRICKDNAYYPCVTGHGIKLIRFSIIFLQNLWNALMPNILEPSMIKISHNIFSMNFEILSLVQKLRQCKVGIKQMGVFHNWVELLQEESFTRGATFWQNPVILFVHFGKLSNNLKYICRPAILLSQQSAFCNTSHRTIVQCLCSKYFIIFQTNLRAHENPPTNICSKWTENPKLDTRISVRSFVC